MKNVHHTGYVSEFTQFIDGYLQQHPEVVEDQRRGWYIFWDHWPSQPDAQENVKDHLPMKGYEYFQTP